MSDLTPPAPARSVDGVPADSPRLGAELEAISARLKHLYDELEGHGVRVLRFHADALGREDERPRRRFS